MKTIQSAVQATASTSRVNQCPLVSKVLLDCMEQLRSVESKIRAYYEANEPMRDCIKMEYHQFDADIHSSASNLSEMMRVDMFNRTFYRKENYNE